MACLEGMADSAGGPGLGGGFPDPVVMTAGEAGGLPVAPGQGTEKRAEAVRVEGEIGPELPEDRAECLRSPHVPFTSVVGRRRSAYANSSPRSSSGG